MMKTFDENIALNEQEIQQGRLILDSSVRRLIVTLSSRCNLDCIMCEVRRTRWDIPQNVIQEIVSLFPCLESIAWQGGEPFLLEYFDKIFDEASVFPNLKQTIVTNGLLITDAWAQKLAKNYVELTFSIDGITQEIYEHIRVGAKFDDVIRSLKMIRDARHKYNSQKMALRLHVVVMRSNYHEMGKIMDFAKEYGFNAIHLISMWGNQGREENIFSEQDKEALGYLAGIRQELEEKAKNLNIDLTNALPCDTGDAKNKPLHAENNGSSANPYPDGLLCSAPWQQLNIDPGGGVRPGCLCLKTVGSVLESNLSGLWNNELMQEYRKKITEKNFSSICNATCLSVQTSEQLKKYKSC